MKLDGFKLWFRLRREALRDFGDRYRLVGGAAWKQRASYDAEQRSRQEAEFLPAALAVQETPVHPAPRIAAILLMALIVLAVGASILMKTEVIVSAQGQLISSGRTKTIQSLESAVVQRILVSEGVRVREGDVVAELFVPGVGTDSARLRAEFTEAEEEYRRGQRLLNRIFLVLTHQEWHEFAWQFMMSQAMLVA